MLLKYLLLSSTSIRAIFANKLRSALTTLGIVIGVAAVVMMVSTAGSASEAVTSTIRGLGSNIVFVFTRFSESSTAQKNLTEADMKMIENIPYVRRVVPETQANMFVSYSSNSLRTAIISTTPDFETVRNTHPAVGRFITENDLISLNRVIVLGATLAEKLFDNESPLGKTVRIRDIPFTVAGVLEKRGGSPFGQSPDDLAIIPITTAQQRLYGTKRIDIITAEIIDESLVGLASEEIKETLKRKHAVKKDEDMFFQVLTQQDILSITGTVTRILTVLLAGIAAISLVVGGIGIMNIMLVSVTERTREIGIRKAVGAKKSDILIQFLIEAVLLCVTGGIVGILLGYAGSIAVAKLGGWTPVIQPSTVILAFSFSAFVGIFFGIYPAYKAASLNPIEALRYE